MQLFTASIIYQHSEVCACMQVYVKKVTVSNFETCLLFLNQGITHFDCRSEKMTNYKRITIFSFYVPVPDKSLFLVWTPRLHVRKYPDVIWWQKNCISSEKWLERGTEEDRQRTRKHFLSFRIEDVMMRKVCPALNQLKISPFG